MTLVVDNLCQAIWEIKNYLNVLVEFFDDAGDGLDVVFQKFSGKQLLLPKAMGSLKTSRDVLLDAEGLLKEESDGALLVVESVFQLTSLGVWNGRKKRTTPGQEKETPGTLQA